jgi:hypothetical protein
VISFVRPSWAAVRSLESACLGGLLEFEIEIQSDDKKEQFLVNWASSSDQNAHRQTLSAGRHTFSLAGESTISLVAVHSLKSGDAVEVKQRSAVLQFKQQSSVQIVDFRLFFVFPCCFF